MSDVEYRVVFDHKGDARWTVHDDRNGYRIGEIKWFGGFDQYCFFSLIGILPKGYLDQISNFIDDLMKKKEHE